MRVNIKLPEIRKLSTPLQVTWVVMGPGHGSLAGTIKTIRYDVHVSCPFFKLETDTDGPKARVIKALHMRAEYQDAGDRFLEEMYLDEDNAEDWEFFRAHQAAIRQGQSVDPFPEERLPRALIAMRTGMATRNKFVIPPKDAGPKNELSVSTDETKIKRGPGRPRKSEPTDAELESLLDESV